MISHQNPGFIAIKGDPFPFVFPLSVLSPDIIADIADELSVEYSFRRGEYGKIFYVDPHPMWPEHPQQAHIESFGAGPHRPDEYTVSFGTGKGRGLKVTDVGDYTPFRRLLEIYLQEDLITEELYTKLIGFCVL